MGPVARSGQGSMVAGDHVSRLWPYGPLYLTESTIGTGETRGRVGLGPVATRETEGLRDQGYLRTT